jgi:hypothetical protein
MPRAPAEVVAHTIFRNAGERVIERIDAALQIAAVFGNGRLS